MPKQVITIAATGPWGSEPALDRWLADGTLRVNQRLAGRAIATFELQPDAPAQLTEGDEVTIDADGARIFGGTIERIDRRTLDDLGRALTKIVTLTDFSEIAERHLVAADYLDPDPEDPTQTAGDIVEDLHQVHLAGDGVTVGEIQDGPFIAQAKWNYHQVSEALTDLSRQTGYTWKIDCFKRLFFVERANLLAPWSLEPGHRPDRRIVYRSARGEYRNRQYLRGGVALTEAPVTDRFVGDGERQTFTCRLPLAETPTIKVNGFVKSVGVNVVDGDADWYWNEGSKEVVQERLDTPLGSTDVLEVTFVGQFPILVQAQDDVEIVARQSDGVGGSTGLYEAIETDTSVTTNQLARFKAEGRLRSLGEFAREITVVTQKPGIEVGQLQQVDLPEYEGLNEQMLVESLAVVDRGAGLLEYSYHAISGEQLGGWPEFFRRLARTGTRFTVRENEIILILRKTIDTVQLSDTVTAATGDLLDDWKDDPFTVAFCGISNCGRAEGRAPTYA